MKTIILSFPALLIATLLHSQTIDTIDNIHLTIPASWKIERQSYFTEITTYNSQSGFCQVVVYKQQPSSSDKNASFQKEWSDVVLASFESPVAARPRAKNMSIAPALSFAAQVKNRATGAPYFVELNVFDFGAYVQTVMIASGNQQQLQAFDSSWQSLITGANKASGQAISATSNSPFSGQWSRTSSKPYGYSVADKRENGSYMCQYDFMTDGTYKLTGQSTGGILTSNEYGLIKETGAYTVLNRQLVLMPAKSELHIIDLNGSTKSRQNLDNARRTYTWDLHYLETSNETNLVLKPAKPYNQDGTFTIHPLFTDAYLYSSKNKVDWKFPLK